MRLAVAYQNASGLIWHSSTKEVGLICMISVGQNAPKMQSWLKRDVAQQLEGRDGEE